MNTQENNKSIAEIIYQRKNNKMIAEFMGDYNFEHTEGGLPIGDFSNSWSWLMSVVEKIECTTTDNNDNSDSFFNVMIEVFECNINGGDICICKSGNTKHEATYKAVVEFINQYNKTK